MYRAVVISTDDPEARGRVRLLIPAVLGDHPSGWAHPVPATGGVPPVADDVVWASFLGKGFDAPVYFRNV